MLIVNITSTHIALKDARGRRIVLKPKESKTIPLNETWHLQEAIDGGLIRIVTEDQLKKETLPVPATDINAFIPADSATLAGSRTIRTVSGIGDTLWMIMKLEGTGEKFHWRLTAEQPQRGHQIFEVLPQTAASVNYDISFGAHQALTRNIEQQIKTWKEIGNRDSFYLAANWHLEAGHHLTGWLPDLPINYYPQYQTQAYVEQANTLLSDKKAKYIGCYGSSYSTSRHWGGWMEKDWELLITELRRRDNTITPIIIGANWDIDMAKNLIGRLEALHIPYIRLIGEKLGLVIEIMRRIRYGFYFPSGIGIIGGTLGVPGTMWYPKHLDPMRGKWCDPALTKSGVFNEILFCTPQEMLKYVDERGGIK
jgi:hypothetical protein